jgi:hypothetical protein
MENVLTSCWHCSTVMSGEYHVEAAWVPIESTTSLHQDSSSGLDVIQEVSVNALGEVWTALGNCTSGVWLF